MRVIGPALQGRLGRARVRHRSFAQSGEDRIASHVLGEMGITKPTYLGLDAHHPVHFSNTYLFYLRSARGVCVEADPRLKDSSSGGASVTRASMLPCSPRRKPAIPRDGVRTLSTTSSSAVSQLTEKGHRIRQTIEVQAPSANTILSRHLDATPNLVSLDVEGCDLEILQTWDFAVHRPQVFIVETLEYAEDDSGKELLEIADRMESVGYFAYADTFVNTIFVDRAAFHEGPLT